MSKRSIPNVDWANQLESVIRQFVKEKLDPHAAKAAPADDENSSSMYT
ncbi:hypothetical protein HUR95_03795 [Caldalkalibacillus thermarum TA2.A1]|uniref:Uncharacterized protein n=1 Tax=Caldalkalibacillus thermarum (strain TA2.A1) TaxID=986075 RepID=A0A8X8LBF6_CALTT|nr:hypothetical protein [Caldalkalibacillus thermarum]QZT34509.1 hypothetical protein HUR95_03795 [Caldalkalibacillus thermarum TA2.A1]